MLKIYIFCSFSLKYLFVAGEHCDHETRLWAQDQFKIPVLDNWWQTETAHAIAATCVGLGNQLNPPKDASGKPVPGFDGKYSLKNKNTVLSPKLLTSTDFRIQKVS